MKKTLLFIPALLLLFISCNQDLDAEYSGDSYIQFDFYTNAGDTIKLYTFAYEPSTTTQSVVNLPVLAVGNPVGYDRYFTVRQVQVDGALNAIPGDNYLPFDSEEMRQACVIKAGEVVGELPVTLYRIDDMTKTFTLRIEVSESSDFRVGDIKHCFRVIEFTSGLQRPRQWRDYQIDWYYGKYSQTKHKWMIDVSGKLWDDDYVDNVASDEFLYWLHTFARKLKEINAEREAQGLGPWCDEDGEVIAFGKYA